MNLFYSSIKNYLTNRIKLKRRIYLGAMTSTLIFIIVMAIFYFILTKTATGFKLFTKYNRDSRIELIMAKDITEMQRQAQIFTYQGYISAGDEVDNIYKKIITKLNNSKIDSELKPIYRVIERHLKSYYKTFTKVKVERVKKSDLINKLRIYETDIEDKLNDYINKTKELSMENLNAKKILNHILSIEKNAFRYFDILDTSFVNKTKNNIKIAKNSLNNSIKLENNKSLKKLLINSKELVIKYEKNFLEAVQRTRGYLFMVNVVMALEAYEILYNSKKVTKKFEDKMKNIEERAISSMQNIFTITLIIGFILIIFLILLSYLLFESITSPIIKLSNTFKELSNGKVDTKIPNYHLNDEIGKLTHSAKIFKEKNQETAILLEKSIKLTKELETKKVELEHSNEELEQFVYTVSHDLKSPLVTSMGFIGIIKKMTLDGKVDKAIEKLDKIVNANERMGQLINDLLEFSRVGRMSIETKKIDLNNLLANFKDNQLIKLEKTNFELIIKPNLPTIEANESRILQVFENILSNALKYVKNLEKNFLEIGSNEDNDYFYIYCKDNGEGIEEEFKEKIFALFYRLNNREEGTGIGLAVVKKVMKFHGGDVWVESKKGEGATFWLKFPKNFKRVEE